MKALTWISVMMVVLLVGTPGRAQQDWVFLADAEGVFPIAGPNEFADRYDVAGYGAGLGIGAIMSPRMMLIVYLSYDYFPADADGFAKADALPGETTLEGGNLSTIYGSVGVRYALTESGPYGARPYVVAGGGWFFGETEDVTATNTVLGEITARGGTENAIGLNAGLGVDVPVAETVNAFLEVQYQVSFVSDGALSLVPVRLGAAFLLGDQ